MTLDRINNEMIKQKQDIEQSLRKLTPLDKFETYEASVEEKSRRLNYCCKDLDNKIKTTDRYIDQFLPFRMIKEVASFMRFLMPSEQYDKIEILKKEKIKELYSRIFEHEEVVAFKEAMKTVQEEASKIAKQAAAHGKAVMKKEAFSPATKPPA